MSNLLRYHRVVYVGKLLLYSSSASCMLDILTHRKGVESKTSFRHNPFSEISLALSLDKFLSLHDIDACGQSCDTIGSSPFGNDNTLQIIYPPFHAVGSF